VAGGPRVRILVRTETSGQAGPEILQPEIVARGNSRIVAYRLNRLAAARHALMPLQTIGALLGVDEVLAACELRPCAGAEGPAASRRGSRHGAAEPRP
jgi:hypothetical protein